jgi:hypothetical protein
MSNQPTARKRDTDMATRVPILTSLLKPPATGPVTGFLWNYLPRTSWFSHFITINNNTQDAPIEEHVLGEVGSYGLQLGEILDAMTVLIKVVETPDHHLDLDDQGKLADVMRLHQKVKAAIASA